MTMEVAIFRMKVGWGNSHSVTVVEAETVTSATVPVTGGYVTVLVNVSTDGTTTVDVAFKVVIKGVNERQEQPDKIFERGKVVR